MNKNSIILLAALLSSCKALDDSRSARILKYDFNNIGTGPYQFRFETSDGTRREEQGTLINENTEDEAVIVKGSYSYTDRDGKVFTVRYTADENGFHPEGDHIKVPPFVPWVKGQPHHHNHHLQGSPGNPPNSQIYLPSTPARPEVPIQYIPSTSPSPSQGIEFLQNTTPNPVIGQEYFATSQRPINLLGEGLQGITNLYIPTTPRNVPFGAVDPRIQRSLVNLISKGDGRRLSIADINAL